MNKNQTFFRFTSKIFHPNIYPDGRVCISILHPPGDDPLGKKLYRNGRNTQIDPILLVRRTDVQSTLPIHHKVHLDPDEVPPTRIFKNWNLVKCFAHF